MRIFAGDQVSVDSEDYEKNKHRRPEGSALGVHMFDIPSIIF